MVMVREIVKNRIGRSQRVMRRLAVESAGFKAEVCTGAGVRWGSKSRLQLDWG